MMRENRRRDQLQSQSADDSIEKVTLDGLRDMTDRSNLRFRCASADPNSSDFDQLLAVMTRIVCSMPRSSDVHVRAILMRSRSRSRVSEAHRASSQSHTRTQKQHSDADPKRAVEIVPAFTLLRPKRCTGSEYRRSSSSPTPRRPRPQAGPTSAARCAATRRSSARPASRRPEPSQRWVARQVNAPARPPGQPSRSWWHPQPLHSLSIDMKGTVTHSRDPSRSDRGWRPGRPRASDRQRRPGRSTRARPARPRSRRPWRPRRPAPAARPHPGRGLRARSARATTATTTHRRTCPSSPATRSRPSARRCRADGGPRERGATKSGRSSACPLCACQRIRRRAAIALLLQGMATSTNCIGASVSQSEMTGMLT